MPRIRNRTIALLVAAGALVTAAGVGGATWHHPGEPDQEEHEAVVFQPNASTGSCGVERWSVKTGTDADSGLINLQSTTPTTIAALDALTKPGSLPASTRIQPTETTVFQVQATLTEYKLEADSDYHLVLSDGSGNTMIAEIPDPACVGSGSPLTSGISNARTQFDAQYSPTTSFQTANVPITVTGVGFFDFLHGQSGVAPNGIELHSVLDVQFGTGTGGGGSVSVTNPGAQTTAVGTAASLQISASDTASSTLTYSATGLPAGLSIDSASGLISGTPTTAGKSNVTVTATDSAAATASTSFTWTVSASSGTCTPTQLLGNADFETGTASPWTASSSVINSDTTSEPSHTGSYDAWLDGYGSTHTDTLAQTVTLPSVCSTATFSYWLHIDTAETTTSARHDTLTLQVLDSTGTVLATLATYSNLDAATGYTQHTDDLSAYAGQSVTLKFTGTENSSLQTSFVIDDTALQTS
jgi:hypothetical protein